MMPLMQSTRFVCVCVCVCVCIHTYIYIYTHTHAYMHACTDTYMHAFIHTYQGLMCIACRQLRISTHISFLFPSVQKACESVDEFLEIYGLSEIRDNFGYHRSALLRSIAQYSQLSQLYSGIKAMACRKCAINADSTYFSCCYEDMLLRCYTLIASDMLLRCY